MSPKKNKQKTQKIQNPRKTDPLFKLKYIGYCISQLPEDGITFDDLVRYAKFQLARKACVLMNDPVWDTYTKEAILAEFYAHQFESSEHFRTQFEAQLANKTGEVDDFANWADKKMVEEHKVLGDALSKKEDKISFNPSEMLLGDEE